MSNKKNEQVDFEKGMQRLEEILEKFDEGGMTLNDMEKNFIEGMELIKKCTERLDKVELRVTQLMNQYEEEDDTESPFVEE